MALALSPRIVRSPVVLPEFVRQCSVRLNTWTFDDIPIPEALRASVPKRQLHFRAGRFCAMEALAALTDGHGPSTMIVARGDGGAPEWPAGVTGSITHTDDFASAAVALTGDAAAIGIDAERVMSDAQALRVKDVIVSPSELAEVGPRAWTRAEALTLVFSAKEAIFKCLHPRVRRMFDYHDVRIEAAHADAGIFEARLVTSLSPRWPAGARLVGRFEIDRPLVHTGICVREG